MRRHAHLVVERMEAEADLINYGRKPDLEEELESLEFDEEIEAELQTLKSSLPKKDEEPPHPE